MKFEVSKCPGRDVTLKWTRTRWGGLLLQRARDGKECGSAWKCGCSGPLQLQNVAESWREARRLCWAVYDFPVSLQGIRKHALTGKGGFTFGNWCPRGSKREWVGDFHCGILILREAVALISSKETRLTVILKETLSAEEIESVERQVRGCGIRED